MEVFAKPCENSVKRLLEMVRLNASDIRSEQLEHFFGIKIGEQLDGVVGLEIYGTVCLLRSLAVIPSKRSLGLGARLLAHGEYFARNKGVKSSYLLTETAEGYFARHGYHRVSRQEAPDAIKATRQFSELCPASSEFMKKQL
jgi:amino-acid N-acetyltransferase